MLLFPAELKKKRFKKLCETGPILVALFIITTYNFCTTGVSQGNGSEGPK